MKPSIDQRTSPVVLNPQTLLTPAKKEVVVDTALGGTWVNMNPRQVIQTGVYGSTLGNIHNAIRVKHNTSSVLIGIVGTSPTCGLNGSLYVVNKQHASSRGLVRKNPKIGNCCWRKVAQWYRFCVHFSKVIGPKLSNISSGDLYSLCRTKFTDYPVQTQAPKFMNLGLLAINAFDEISSLSTPATRILWHTDGTHWSVPGHVFGEAIEVGMRTANSGHDYNCKPEFQVWKENKKFERQNILMIRTTLGSTPSCTNTINKKISYLDSTPVGTKVPDPKPITLPIE